MAFKNLGEFIARLESAGELVRVSDPVRADIDYKRYLSRVR